MSALCYQFLRATDRLLARVCTQCLRGAFADFGTGSRIGRSVKLDSPELVVIGSGVVLSDGIWLNAKNLNNSGKVTLSIGDGSYIGRFAQINAWAQVRIESHVLIGDRVLITDADHNYRAADIPIIKQGDSFQGPVLLKEGCWIGAGAVILPGVCIGKNAVVAANAVVTRNVDDGAVVAGVPARVISDRG